MLISYARVQLNQPVTLSSPSSALSLGAITYMGYRAVNNSMGAVHNGRDRGNGQGRGRAQDTGQEKGVVKQPPPLASITQYNLVTCSMRKTNVAQSLGGK